MPPPTPRTTRGFSVSVTASLRSAFASLFPASSLLRAKAQGSFLAGPSCSSVQTPAARSLALGVLEQAGVDLAERDRQRLLAGTGLDEWSDVLEQALTELRVVVVDLPGTLGRVDHQGVLGADLVEQVVDRGIGDALELLARGVAQCAQLGGGDHSWFSN